jgi:UDP-2,4-diacetamido-2,4,6-trideoxy-beta-L-altropyranose hydrolase
MKSDKVYLRCDGNRQIGLGHMYRLYALFNYLKDDFKVEFIIDKDSYFPFNKKDVAVNVLEVNSSSGNELEQVKSIVGEGDWVVLDGYHFGLEYEKALRDNGVHVMKIDDFCASTYAHIIVNQDPNIGRDEFPKDQEGYPVLKKTGTSNALLRKAFSEETRKAPVLNQNGEVLVCFGGDPLCLGEKLISSLVDRPCVNKIHWLGSDLIFDRISDISEKVKLHKNLSEEQIIKLAKQCQLACVPCSTIFQELCCVGISIVCGYFIDNQSLPYNRYKQEEIFYPADELAQGLEDGSVVKLINRILENFNLEEEMIIAQKQKELFKHNFSQNYIQLLNEA